MVACTLRRDSPVIPDDDREEAEAFRPVRRPAWVAIVLNAALLTLALGVPYVRGRWRAQHATSGFTRLAACLHGGRAAEDGGLAMPSGDREHYAARVERAAPDWPGECTAILAEMRPEPAIFLMPATKTAEEDLRRALDIAEAELVALGAAREDARTTGTGIGVVPERPLRALTQLRSALANALIAADVSVDPTALAIVLDADDTIVAPSRIPLRVAAGGTTIVRPEPGGLRVMASDGHRVSEVVVREGSVFETLTRRPTAARGITLGPDGGRLLWITSDSTCASDPAHCSARLLGVAPLEQIDDPVVRWWLAAHPALRIDRAVRFEPGAASVIAIAGDGEELELRRFALDPDAAPPPEGDVAPIAASEKVGLGRAIDALLVAGGGVVRVVRDSGVPGLGQGPALRVVGDAMSAGSGQLASGPGVAIDGVTIPLPIVPVAGEGGSAPPTLLGPPRIPRPGEALIARCGAAWTAVALRDGVAVIAPGASEASIVARDLREPVRGASPTDDAMQLVCTEDGVDVIALDREHRVLRWACTASACAEAQVVARGATQFAAAHAAGTTLVAWTGDVAHPQVRVARVRGEVIGGSEVPGPCWAGVSGDAGSGMCGAPFVVAEGERLLVATREHADLLVLELAEIGFRRLARL
jgi:hypothetical protein